MPESINADHPIVTVLGASGVGKTTLLTSMYEQFNETVRNADLQLTPDPQTSNELSDHLMSLKELLGEFEVSPEKSLQGTSEKRSYFFGLGKKGKQPEIKLELVDFPGDFIREEENAKVVEELLLTSLAVLIPIDAPALMEAEGRWNARYNQVRRITDWFKRTYINLEREALVILAPVKCEKYLSKPEAAQELLDAVKASYSELLDFLGAEGLKDKVTVVVTPVQTVGNVVFSRIIQTSNLPRFKFLTVGKKSPYDPRDTEQPLRYLLRFILKHKYDQNRREWLGLFGFLRDWLKLDAHLITAMEKFAEGCKTGGIDAPGFEIIQGHSLLDIPKK